ncbi:MAG: thiamine pyrophosphate-dependent enzyme [Acinetobacter sp.]
MNSSNSSLCYTGYNLLFDFFAQHQIQSFFGVTGGGVIHFLKHIPPYPHGETSFYNLAEYSAGFAPLGYYLATGKIAAAVATLGAATKLLTCGLSDAKLHDIPAVYIVPAYSEDLAHKAALQDSSQYGSNAIAQLKAECPEAVFVLHDISQLRTSLEFASMQLQRSKPVVFVLIHASLAEPINNSTAFAIPQLNPLAQTAPSPLKDFSSALAKASKNKRLTVLIGEEMARYPNAKKLSTQLSEKLNPYIICSMNGANAVDRDNPCNYGHIGFGGNDIANKHMQSLDENDVLLVLGACPDEYTMNLYNFSSGDTFFCTGIPDAYGQFKASFQHRAEHRYFHLNAPIDTLILKLCSHDYDFQNLKAPCSPPSLNTREISAPQAGYADMKLLYERLDQWWPEHSIAFSDVCLAYKDRHYITQRPNNHIDFYALYRGSAMGNALGLSIGAKLADQSKNVFAFTGDGCFKLFSGSLAEAADLGLVLFVLNNQKFSIVEQGLHTILNDVPPKYWHAEVKSLDYCMIARASNWNGVKLNTDLSNLESILNESLVQTKSLLIEVPVDPHQILGINPRVHNL